MSTLWPASAAATPVRERVVFDALEGLRQARGEQLRSRTGSVTPDQLRDVRVLTDLEEDLVFDRNVWHNHYGLEVR